MKFEPDDMPLKTMPLLPLSAPVKFSVAPGVRVSEPPLRMPLPAAVVRASVFSPIAAVTEPMVSVPPLTLPRLSCSAPPCKVIGWLPKRLLLKLLASAESSSCKVPWLTVKAVDWPMLPATPEMVSSPPLTAVVPV